MTYLMRDWKTKLTTIIAIENAHGVVICADAQTTSGNGRILSHPNQPKIIERGKFLLAGSGDSAPCDIFQHNFKPPLPRGGEWNDLLHFMIVKFVPALKQCFREHDWKKNPDDSDSGFDFLVVIGGEIFSLDCYFSITKTATGIYGVGSGSTYAVGALLAGASMMEALEIAEQNDAYTSGPFLTLSQSRSHE